MGVNEPLTPSTAQPEPPPEQPQPLQRWRMEAENLDFRGMVESAPAYFYVADPADSTTLYRSPQAVTMLGYSLEEWQSNDRLWNEILHPEDRQRVEAQFAEASRGGKPFQVTYRLFTKSGLVRWVRDHAALTRDATGRLLVRGVVLDITELVVPRMEAEERLSETLSLLETAQRVGKVGTFVVWLTPERKGQDVWSKSCLAIFGLDENTHAGRNDAFWQRIHPDDLELVRAEQSKAIESGRFYDQTHRIVRPDGEVRWIRERAQIERAADGSPIRLLGVTMDITEEHELQDAIVRAQTKTEATAQFYDEVFEHAPLGVCKADVHLTVTAANARLHEMLKAAPGSIVGRSVAEFLDPDGMSQVMEEFRPLWKGEVTRIDSAANAIRTDGGKVWFQWSATAVRDDDGRIEYFLAMFEDITAKRQAEVAAVNSLAALERLNYLKSEFVSLVSHEFRTALTGIQGFSEILRDEDLSRAEVKDFAKDINNDALRLNRMISEMLDLDRIESGRVKLELAPHDVNALIRDAVDRAAGSTHKHRLVTELDPTLPHINCDGDRVTQVVANLLSNAIKYSPDGGEIKVSSTHDGSIATFRVQDHGLGMPPDFLTRVFDRYERLEDKSTHKILGTGLGLPICKQIVEMHGGKIGVETDYGKGSTFWFNLPLGTMIGTPTA